MSKKGDKGAEKAAGKKDKKKGKGSRDAAAGPSVAAHPRASYQVRRAKGWGGIAGFALAGYLSYKAGVPTFDLALRALIAGIVGYMLAWACAVTVWRQLLVAELRAAVERASGPDPDLIPARAEPVRNASPEQAAAGS
ncbi:MAG TPA: hypothetical protein VEF89_12695 [Solirubrobacteraceae bacterium]|nr:hypothetical protein [Solirubrobacteraceae bacterium]